MPYPKQMRMRLALLLVLVAAGCGDSTSTGRYVAPDLSALPGDWAGGVVDCQDTPTWDSLGDQPGVRDVTCAEFVDVNAVSGPEALLAALKSSVAQAMPSAVMKSAGCRPFGSSYPLAIQNCEAIYGFDDADGAAVQVFVHLSADGDGLRVLKERSDANGGLAPGDYREVPLTAWVAVAWGIPVVATA